MKNEKDLWKFINSRMGNRWDAQRHEDKIAMGIPDVSFGMQGINGWIELKYMPKYPKKYIKFKHYTAYQKNWLERRQSFGGNCWLLVGIENDFYLFDGGKTDVVYRGDCSQIDFKEGCYAHLDHRQISSFTDWLYSSLLANIPVKHITQK